MTKGEISEMLEAVPIEETVEFLRNALKIGKLTETEISDFFGVPFETLGISEIHRDNFRV